jgi:integrase
VFGIFGENGQPLSTRWTSRYISAIGKAAGIVTNRAESPYATALDLRRSFCTRWSRRIMPADLKVLARHASITTTMTYYISQSAEDMGDLLRSALGTNSGTNEQNGDVAMSVDIDANGVKINS